MDADTDKPMNVIIVGGGTAGWMAASTLAKYFGSRLNVTLIESSAIGTIGVGEATIPQIRLFNKGLGIDEKPFLAATHGTYKLGISFIDWHRKGSRYFHGFGDVGRAIGLVPFYQYWLRYHAEGGELALDEFCANATAATAGRYGVAPGKNARLPASAYHFDAERYAAFLRNYAETRGVTRHEGLIVDTQLCSETGSIRAVALEDGTSIDGDLFIDCSGFRALLIEQALGSGFEDWSHWLPCDRAVAMPSGGRAKLDPFTRSTARDAGWQWEIPLQHRTGNGHVFSSAFTTEDDATRVLETTLPGAALADPRLIRFTTGKRREIWKKNCISLGLASGFLEPLESTSIHLVQAGIARLLALFPDRHCCPALIAEYNKQMDFEYTAVRDFIILHYHVTERDDTAFWRYCRSMQVPETLKEKIELFSETATIVRHNTELFDVPSWLQVMLGQGVLPQGHHPMVDAVPDADLAKYIAMNAREVAEQVAALDDHDSFVRRMTGSSGKLPDRVTP